MHGSAGKNVEPAEKPHLRRPAREQNFETAAIVRSKKNDRRSVARGDHLNSVYCLEGENQQTSIKQHGFSSDRKSISTTIAGHFAILVCPAGWPDFVSDPAARAGIGLDLGQYSANLVEAGFAPWQFALDSRDGPTIL
jgi:hypothetical protein